MNFQAPRGTNDILPQQIYRWQDIENKSRHIFLLYNYSQIRTPVFENINLFKRSLGNNTDIVQKQMFVFKHGNDQFVLRPEATAAIARAYLENNLGFGIKLRKLFYIGPMFRAERPQRGRLRQFHHIGVEAIGSFSPDLDIEIIELADCLLKNFDIHEYKFIVNSLGCDKDKTKFSELLKKSLSKFRKDLCNDCQNRLSRNIFRVLDCKNEQCKKITSSLKFDHSYFCSACKIHFDTVIEGLDRFKINYELNEKLVRGLDYYSGTVFEIIHPKLGAQDALGAGGRYDYLFKELSNKQIGAVGFAFGQERLLLAISKKPEIEALDVYITPLGQMAAKRALDLSREIRAAGIRCDLCFWDGSLKSKLNEANRLNAKFVIIIGEDELTKGKVIIRYMKESRQEEVEFSDIVNFLKQNK